ncbi:phosphoserine phosphatase SerB [Catenovulum sp. 2E275]|uniref:phosphoserine phosphatase SerB n=1 Tax=Catenovulum sp. 2E275 TaxID=2980497 RepID=UPI0021CF98E7|nr:phosphoserine phosphatase SerB [Catenovulum sp. 2E275]MCU4676998.1 phosphoserine phosphatase SerB [Catenovulum sp. 2E275]
MNPFSELTEQTINSDALFATHYLPLLCEQNKKQDTLTIELDPADATRYRLTSQFTATGPELIIYAQNLTQAQFDHVSRFCQQQAIQMQTCYLIAAIDGQNDCAVSWCLNQSLTENVFAELKQWALEQGLEIWQVNQRPSLSEPGLLLMDMDSTTIKIECIDEIAKLAGVGEEVAKVTELAMLGKLDFAESLRGRVATLKDCNESVLQSVADNLPLMHGLERLIKVLKQHHWKVAIASGGFTFFADKLKAQLGLDAAVANVLTIENGKLTGEITGEIVDAQVKARTLNELAASFNIPQSQTVAMGDGANDLVMMSAADLGVAFEAKPIVQDKADVAINHHGLDALLFILKA